MRKNRVAQYMVWVMEIFTEAKSFEANPILGNRLLNRLGLHVIRLIIARLITGFRRWILGWKISSAHRRGFRQKGYLRIDNVLPPELFKRLQDEGEHSWPEVREFIQGDTTTQLAFLTQARLKQLPATSMLCDSASVRNLLNYVASNALRPWPHFLRVCNRGGEMINDPQKHFHSDTFHPTMKAWLFLEDVTADKGPFQYVQGSNRLTLKRLLWEYRQSIQGRSLNERYAARGSLRIAENELASLNLFHIQTFNVPANTLIIADTSGFHRRGEAAADTSRLSVYFSSRLNPFVPFPLPDFEPFNRFAEKLVAEHVEKTTLPQAHYSQNKQSF
ncbi:phytanoyl-CoA dioxygenase family protein [Amphritea sp.]|uniref:phytanoyl-CoA dioxygenase family protein n=1 Tax=Amphritea sp. TaxID=1872502 RepID=UPI003D1282A7